MYEKETVLTGAVTVNSSPGVVSPPPAQNLLCLIESQRNPQAHHCDAAPGPCWEKGVSLIYLYEAVHNLKLLASSNFLEQNRFIFVF
jgi:hypothetical protein